MDVKQSMYGPIKKMFILKVKFLPVQAISCYQLGLDCGYAGPTIAGVEAAGA